MAVSTTIYGGGMATHHHPCESRSSTLASVALTASLLVAFTLAGTWLGPGVVPDRSAVWRDRRRRSEA